MTKTLLTAALTLGLSLPALAGEYGAVEFKSTELADERADIAGGTLVGTWGGLRIGAGFYLNMNDIELNESQELDIRYGGLLLGYGVDFTKYFQIQLDTLLGSGVIERKHQSAVDGRGNQYVYEEHHFDMAEVRLTGKVRITDRFKLTAGAYQFYAGEFTSRSLEDDDISNSGVSFGFEIGNY